MVIKLLLYTIDHLIYKFNVELRKSCFLSHKRIFLIPYNKVDCAVKTQLWPFVLDGIQLITNKKNMNNDGNMESSTL